MPHRTATGRPGRHGWAWGDLAYPAAIVGLMAAAPFALPRLIDGAAWLITMVGL